MNKVIDCLLHDPKHFLQKVNIGILTRCARLFPDKLYLKLMYRNQVGKRLNLENPKTFTEKLQWLKLYNRKPEYTKMVDKVLVKQYVASIIGSEFIIPTLYVWDNVNQIDENVLPEKFVIKCNHYGGGNVFICKDKSLFDFSLMKRRLKKQMKKGIYWSTREWPYKNIDVKILCEPYMEDEFGELRDYKFYCFDGEVKACLIASNRFSSHNFTYYDPEFHLMDIESSDGVKSMEEMHRPKNFDQMIEISSKLSKGLPHVRVDLYDVFGKIYFGELTFFDSSGYDDLNSEKWNKQFGDWITLPQKEC